MLIQKPQYSRLANGPESNSSMRIPVIYESVEPEIARWEYHVLAVDTRETALPASEQLNALGRDGWIMSGLLDEHLSGQGAVVYYYFVRQAQHS